VRKPVVNESRFQATNFAFSTQHFTSWSSSSKYLRSVVSVGKFGRYSPKPWSSDARVGACEKLSGAQTEVGQTVTVTFGDAFDHSMDAEATGIAGHPSPRSCILSHNRFLSAYGSEVWFVITRKPNPHQRNGTDHSPVSLSPSG